MAKATGGGTGGGGGGRGGGGAVGGLGDGNIVLTIGTNGADVLFGDHLVAPGPWGDLIYGMGGNDRITVAGGDSFLYGGTGDDWMLGGSNNDLLNGGAGNDVMNGGLGIDWVDYQDATGGVTVDLARTTAQNTGSMGFDTLSNFEMIAGSAFADVLKAASIGSTIYGFLGNDLLTGRAGADLLNGGVGDDSISGGGGNDTIVPEDWASIGNDTVDGGTGIDTIDYFATAGAVTVNLSLTTAQNTVSGGIDTIINVENVSGSLYADTLTGNGLANSLFGWTGNDILSGAGGNDALDGFAGADKLFGGAGSDVLSGGVTGLATEADQLTGGAGADVFVFTDATWSTATGTDQILDFTASQGDKIDIHGLALLAANFIGAADFTGVAGQIHAVDLGGTYRVEVDSNGDGIADGLVIDVTSATALTTADFLF